MPAENATSPPLSDVTTYLLADARQVHLPTHSNEARRCVLNALRTITPTLCFLRLGDLGEFPAGQGYENETLYFIVYDWFYRNNDLRMLVVDFCLYHLHDASVLREDLLHLARSSKKLIQTVPDMQLSSFAGFYIQCRTSGTWHSLDQVLCTSVKRCRLNSSLLNWLDSSTMQFLRDAENPKPPTTWRPFQNDLHGQRLYSTAQLPLAWSHHEASYGYVPDACCAACQQVQRCSRLQDLLRFIPEAMDRQLSVWIAPTLLAVADKPPPIAVVAAETTQQQLKCQIQACEKTAKCFWNPCCTDHMPLLCENHAAEVVGASTFSLCPKHRAVGQVVVALVK